MVVWLLFNRTTSDILNERRNMLLSSDIVSYSSRHEQPPAKNESRSKSDSRMPGLIIIVTLIYISTKLYASLCPPVTPQLSFGKKS